MAGEVTDFRVESWELAEMVSAIEPPQTFLTNRYFGGVKMFTTETIEWDIEEGGQRLAPFVAPTSQGVHIRSSGFIQATIKPAYIKPKKTLTPQDGKYRTAGESYGVGQMTPKQRIDAALARQLLLHEQMLTNRQEWMASKALCDGQITISGEHYPSTLVDFGRASTLSKTIVDGVQWDDAGGLPFADIELVATDVRTKSYGVIADEVIMESKAWEFFRAKCITNPIFDNQQRFGNGTMDIGPRNGNRNGEYMGKINRFNFWVYDGAYEDNDGNSVKFLPDYTALVMGNVEGIKYYGAIEDLEQGLTAARMYHKTWLEKDPSGVTLLSQSAPILGPRRRNGNAKILVKS